MREAERGGGPGRAACPRGRDPGLLRRFPPGATLREHLGLPRPAGRR
ncbi:hypothetical protein ACFYXS_29270 [Streptomyces sp. NPDC002574]